LSPNSSIKKSESNSNTWLYVCAGLVVWMGVGIMIKPAVSILTQYKTSRKNRTLNLDTQGLTELNLNELELENQSVPDVLIARNKDSRHVSMKI